MSLGKRGLSGVVTTVLIILIVLSAIVIIWSFLRPVINKSAGQVNTDSLSAGLSIVKDSLVLDANGCEISFLVKRGGGKEMIIGYYVVLEKENGDSLTFRENKTMSEFESDIFSRDFGSECLGKINSISIVPILLDENGNEIISKNVFSWVLGREKSDKLYNDGNSNEIRYPLTDNSGARNLPIYYTPAQAIDVFIIVHPGSSVEAYGLEETPPVGWTISDISCSPVYGINCGGLYDYEINVIKWDAADDAQLVGERNYTYRATPPMDESSIVEFSGITNFDGGSNNEISGDRFVSLSI